MNMTVLYKKCTYGLLLIATTIIGGLNFCSAGSYTYTGTFYFNNKVSGGNVFLSNTVPLISSYINSNISVSCTLSNFSSNLNGKQFTFRFYKSLYSYFDGAAAVQIQTEIINYANTYTFVGTESNVSTYGFITDSSVNAGSYFDYSCTVSGDNIINQADLNSSSSPCSPEGSCTVNDKLSDNLLYTGSVSLNNSSYTNIFNYGTNGAGTYCVKLSSSSPQTLTFGFTNSSTGTPTNLYQLYNDQYGNWVCLYGNKSYFNAKLNSSSNTVSYEVYKLTDLLSDNIPCSEGNGSSCDYSDYELKSDITENYCKNKFSSLMTSSECDSLYSGYVAPNIYQICTNSLNSCSNELTTCNTTLTSCINGNFTGNVMRSALYINNVQHLSNDKIYITIPEEIERDYVNIDDETDIEITGYGYDQNAMQEMVNTQFTPPSAEDMENIIGKVADFLPLVAIMLLIVYAWWLIKKVF